MIEPVKSKLKNITDTLLIINGLLALPIIIYHTFILVISIKSYFMSFHNINNCTLYINDIDRTQMNIYSKYKVIFHVVPYQIAHDTLSLQEEV